jgi:reductive dehalogenase
MALAAILLVFEAILIFAIGLFTLESLKEREPRAPKVGLAATLVLLLLAPVILFLPALRPLVGLAFGFVALFGLACAIPGKANNRALKGSQGYAVQEVERFDERDIVFARNRSLPAGSDVYKRYYAVHPDKEAKDAERRAKGGPLGRPGSIDKGYRPNVSMIRAGFELPAFLGPHALAEPPPESSPAEMDPAEATRIVKGFARRLGAALVGVCRVRPMWTYSHRGEIFYDNWEEWGAEIPSPLPFAVVVATEMDRQNVNGGPHTPTVVESSYNYAKGAFITTALVQWAVAMGYRAVAHHNRHYDLLMVPLAVDAGLGELGRLGYLITERFGPRVRLFAVSTDLPLVPDKPVDLGVEGFCERCLKCADSCPSRSIPHGQKGVTNGIERWKLNEETCFDYWAKVGTDCSVCMGVCPFSRPDRPLHRFVRWFIRRSPVAQRVFPQIDNVIYGKKWRPRKVPDWVDYPR